MTRPTTPLLTVDLIIRLKSEHPPKLVVIERKYPPLGWAFPGGFVDVGETLAQAAIREAKEETALDVCLRQLLGAYSDPARDQRGHTVSLVYIADAEGTPRAQDDAKAIGLFALNSPPPLVFDHDKIWQDYLHYLASGQLAPMDR